MKIQPQLSEQSCSLQRHKLTNTSPQINNLVNQSTFRLLFNQAIFSAVSPS